MKQHKDDAFEKTKLVTLNDTIWLHANIFKYMEIL